MTKDRPGPPAPGRAASAEVEAFLKKVAQAPAPHRAADGRGRLVFAMDATASREPSWDQACHIQAEMFRETAALGGLEIQLAWYRGFGEFEASPWAADAATLLRAMTGVACHAGQTQIARVLRHAAGEARRGRVNALVFVGDCVEEDADALAKEAGELALLGVPVFVFHEGGEPIARRAFEHIARITRGAYCPFDAGSAKQLRDLLAAVAVYAAGGRRALVEFANKRGGAALRLTHRVGGR